MRSITDVLKRVFLILPIILFCNTVSAQPIYWSTNIPLSATGQNAFNPEVAYSADGTKATAIWVRSNGSANIAQSASATISNGVATWGAVTDLSAVGATAGQVHIALSADGTKATAVWTRHDNYSYFVAHSASATISGNTATWGATTDLSVVGGSAGYPKVALSSDGTVATAIWRKDFGFYGTTQVATATISGSTATWSATGDLTTSGNGSSHQIAISSDGTKATAVWTDNAGNVLIHTASATLTGNAATWSTPATISASGQNASGPQLGLSSDGTLATALWQRSNGTHMIIQAISATISGNTATWDSITDVSATGQSAYEPQFKLTPDGARATAVWRRSNGTNTMIESASATLSGSTATWGSVSTISATGKDNSNGNIALSSDGSKASVIWVRTLGMWGSDPVVQTTSGTISGTTPTWGTITDRSLTGQNAAGPRVVISSDGTGAVGMWHANNGTNVIINAATASETEPPTPTPTNTPTATSTRTSTSTATSTATSTNTNTATATATSTPSNTATSTSTFTPTNTPTFTNTSTNTPVNTATNTPTNTATVPAATPTFTPTITPTIATTELKGKILDENGDPVSGVVIYLYKQEGNSDLPIGAKANTQKVDGTLSTMTNDLGEYSFTSVPPGVYKIIPDNIAFTFQPTEVSLSNGTFAPSIEARTANLNDTGCDRTELAEIITRSDEKARELMNFALDKVSQYKKKAKKELSEGNAVKLNRSLSGAATDLRTVFTVLLDQSRALPKIELKCPARNDCEAISYKKAVKRYLGNIEDLKRLSLFILRRSNDAFGGAIPSEELDRKVRRLYKASRAAGRFLPRKSDSCL